MEPRPATGPPPRALDGPGGANYELDESLVAVHGDEPGDAGAPVASFEGGTITVLRAPPSRSGPDQLGPVYRAGPGGPIAAPTGRVFIRFREGADAKCRSGDIASAGYTLESVPSYAPHAAWVRSNTGRVADALVGLDRLRELPDVERVEPQFVAEAARRD